MLIEVNHPIILEKITRLRDVKTPSQEFRALVIELGMLLTLYATDHLPITPVEVKTPLMTSTGVSLQGGNPVVISIMRAGNALLEGVLRSIPASDVGHIGLVRDEETLQPLEYLVKLPILSNRHVIVVDPMLATGNSANAALNSVGSFNPASTTLMCLVAAPEGLAKIQHHHPDIRIVTAAIDNRLNEKGYILPGLGDAGDRIYGTE
tara:strand:- start:197 stop:817 length:621 start_codon:yes stop_codon:yes gene_type:complete